MWFCDFEHGTGYSKPLPWFRVMEPLQKHHRLDAAPPLPSIEIRSTQDIAAQKASPELKRHRILLRPGADVIRDQRFVQGVVDLAKAGNHVIVFDGSTSSHAFHIILASGVPVYSTLGSGRRRALRRREFGKLVRDKIPERIAQGGEAVTFAKIPDLLRRQLFIAKAYEELWELSEAEGEARVEELADLFEVFRTILKELGIPMEEVENQADAKGVKRGGFSEGLVLIETKLAEDEDEPTLLQPEASRLFQTSPQKARTSALQIERDGNTVEIPVFRLLAEQKGVMIRLPLTGGAITVQCRIEGDRFTLEVVEAEQDSELLDEEG
jgi:predicted house-cleaning noncanonical NTP pyrophosphatase (MazG superfamily)